MARYNSAQVVINEIDVSALADVVFGRPYLMLGEAVQGRDDQPTLVQNKANYVKQFGNVNGSFTAPYAAMEYLAYGNQLYYKRVTSTKFTRIAASAVATIDVSAGTLSISNTPPSPGNTISPFLTAETIPMPTTSVSVAGNTFACTNPVLVEQQPVVYYTAGGTAITTAGGDLVNGTTYYIKNVNSTTFELSLTAGGASIDLTGTGNNSQYFGITGVSQAPVALYLKDLVGTRGLVKAYITGWNSTSHKYNILLDSYGQDYSALSLGSPLTVDLYIGHAEPAFNSSVMFPPSTLTNSSTNQSTVTWDVSSVGEYYVSGLSLSASPKYVSSVATNGESYGPNSATGVTTVVSQSATTGALSDLEHATGSTIVIGYRITFTDGTNESAASQPFFAVDSNATGAPKVVNVAFTALPALPSGYTGYNLYRSSDVVTIASATPSTAQLDASKVTLCDEATKWFKVPTTITGTGVVGDPYIYSFAVRTTLPFNETTSITDAGATCG